MTSPAQELHLPSLQDVHVVVVGDVMLDRYWHGSARRVSQEAPVPVVAVDREEARPGGAANVALNLVALGARCTLVGVTGEDETGVELRGILEAAGVVCEFLALPSYRTVEKLRIISQRQQLIRTDFESEMPDCSRAIAERVQSLLAEAGALVLQDYDKGTLLKPEALIQLARGASVPVLVDPKSKALQRYAGADLVKPNDQEFQALAGRWESDEAFARLAQEALDANAFGALVVTQGSRGMSVVETGNPPRHLPAREVEVFDVTGAGDTVIAVLAIGQALGWSAIRSARLANVAAGLVVAKLGTATVSGPELAFAVAQIDRSDRGVLTFEQAEAAVRHARETGQRVVFTNGCFDILHAGHVTYLEEARALGDRLIVAVNDDDSVRRLKGPNRPINPLTRRQRVLSGLQSVDWVVGFAEDTPERLLEALHPDVLVKGGDYGPDAVVGHEIVNAYGGDVRVLSLVEDCSTTDIVNAIERGPASADNSGPGDQS